MLSPPDPPGAAPKSSSGRNRSRPPFNAWNGRLRGSFAAGLRVAVFNRKSKGAFKMLFFVQTIIGVTSRAILKRESERRLYFATDRFQTQIREIDVVLRDVNGPRGGVDKLCRITARLRHGGSLAIEEKST